MPNWAWFLAGVTVGLVGWALILGAVWWRTAYRTRPEQRRGRIWQDFQDVRDTMLQQHANERN